MAPFLGEAFPWPATHSDRSAGYTESEHGPGLTPSSVSVSRAEMQHSTDHVTQTRGEYEERGEEDPGLSTHSLGAPIAPTLSGPDITTTTKMIQEDGEEEEGEIWRTFIPPDLGGGATLLTTPSNNSHLKEHEVVTQGPGGEVGDKETRGTAYQLAGQDLEPSTSRIEIGERVNKTAVDVCLGVLGSLGGVAVIGGLWALGCRLCRSQTGIVLQIQAKQRVDSSFNALSRALQRIPDLIDSIGRSSQEEILNPSAEDTGDQGEEHVAQAGRRSVA